VLFRSIEDFRNVWVKRGYLPHFDGHGAIQHVTFHLADSLPKETLIRLQRETACFPDTRKNTELRKRIETFIDSGYGSCALKNTKIAEMIQNTLIHFNTIRYTLIAWTVMPNHIHVLFEALPPWPMPKIIASWKKHTARIINAVGKTTSGNVDLPIGRQNANHSSQIQRPRPHAPVWHREYWDRFIRDESHFLQTIEYIRMNPVKAGLVDKPDDWPWTGVIHRDTVCPVIAKHADREIGVPGMKTVSGHGNRKVTP
jgi:REP element-mobilizing transposase RayT